MQQPIHQKSVEIAQKVTAVMLEMTRAFSDVPPYSTDNLPAPGTANRVAVDRAVLHV